METLSGYERIMLTELIGMKLPPRQIIYFLLDNYLNSVHWFVIVFHEPTLREELDQIVTSGSVQKSRLSFLTLILVILVMGAKYANHDIASQICPGFSITDLESKLIAKVEEKFLDIFDNVDIESVQTGVLLATYYVYHSKPTRAYVVVGATLKSAKALGLNRESNWGTIDILSREIRRRAWWALYAADA